MVSKKRKRRIAYNGRLFFWFVRKNDSGIPNIHIVSEDKKIHLKYHLFDTEIPVTKKDVEKCLNRYFASK